MSTFDGSRPAPLLQDLRGAQLSAAMIDMATVRPTVSE
jgi:hypothetical protein